MDIAIVGMAGMFPEAGDFFQFHQNLKNGRDSVRQLSERRRLSTALPRGDYQAGGFIEEIEFFDPQFFGISADEAGQTDPHQRLLLQTVYQAIENTGNAGKITGGNTDLYVALPSLDSPGLSGREEVDGAAYPGDRTGLTAERIARHFDLPGRAVRIDTTYYSSLYAVHLACNAIRSGETGQAVVCAARLMLVPPLRPAGDSGPEAPGGKTKAFAWRADGTDGGEAVAAVVLKPLSRALQDNDNIHAVIKATAASRDGQRSSHPAAPGKGAQAEVIQASWQKAGIPAESIGFILARGAGTPADDSIEMDGLDLAFKTFTSRRQFVPVASPKTNIGHTDACAGLCSLIAAVLSVKYGQIYPSLHYDKPNPLTDSDEKAVFVNAELRSWPVGPEKRRAGVSSSDPGGTNVHVVVEGLSGTTAPGGPAPKGGYLFTASGKTARALRDNLERVGRFLRECDAAGTPPADLSYTSTKGRPHYEHRAAVVFRDVMHLAALLEDQLHSPGGPRQSQGPAVLLLAGALPECDLRDVFAVSAASLPLYEEVVAAVNRPLTPPWQQFVFQYVLAKFLSGLGLSSGSVAGVGIGEVVASALAGNVPLAEAIRRVEDHLGGGAAEPGAEAMQAAAAAYAHRFVLGNFPPGAFADPAGFAGHRIGKGPDLLLACLAALYTGGQDIQWAAFHEGGPGSVIDLPGYPFEQHRCWTREPLGKRVDEWLYTLEWAPLAEAPAGGPAGPEKRFLLLGADTAGLAPELFEECAGHNVHLVRVNPGKTFRKVDEDTFTLDYQNEFHFKMLAQHLRQRIDGVVDLSSCAYPTPQPASFREEVLASLAVKLHVVKAFEPLLAGGAFAMVYVTNRGQNAGRAGVDFINCLAGTFLRSLLSEYPALKAKLIDVDLHHPVPLGRILLAELFSASHLRFVAYRNHKRYVQHLVPLPLGVAQENPAPSGSPGPFLVTGGASGVGLVIARHLARQYPGCRLIILGRTRVEGQEAATPETRAARGVAQLRALGASVRYYSVDIGDQEQLKKTFGQIGREHDRIDQVYHAAGIAGKWHPTRLKKVSDFDVVFGPKVYGSLYLDQAVQPFRPRLFVCISSINALVPHPESAEYALADAFADAFAWNRRSAACRYVSINWPGWLLEDRASPDGQDFNALRNITPEDGMAALGLCLRADRPNVIVADVDLQDVKANPFFTVGGARFVPAGEDARPPETAQPGRQTDVLAGVMALFREILKPEALTEDSDFFDLGGNSLTGAQLVNALHDAYGVQLGVGDLLDTATPAQITGHLLLTRSLDGKQAPVSEPAPIEEQDYYRPLLEQQGWWIRSKYWTEPFPFHMSQMYETPDYEEATFRKTFQVLLRRHEALRSGFFLREGDIRVRVHDPETLVLDHQFADCSGEPDPRARAAELFEPAGSKPFALDEAPLFRTLTVKYDENRFYTLLVIHHIISDAVTIDVLQWELMHIYRSLKGNEEPQFEPLKIQYKDFAAWRALEMKLHREELLKLWRTTVVPAVTGPHHPASFSDLLTEKPLGYREALQADLQQHFHPWVVGNVNEVHAVAGIAKPLVGASYVVFIDTPLLNELKLFSRQERITPFILTSAVLALLHHQITGRRDLVFGAPVSLRNDKACEAMMGWFLSTNLLYIHTRPDQPFLDWLRQTGEGLWAFLKYRMYPFEKLLEDLELSPAYVDTVFLNYITTDGLGRATTAFEGAGHRGHGTPTFDINFTFTEYADGVKLVCDYRPALFTPGAIERIVDEYLELLEKVLLNPKEQTSSYIRKTTPVA